MKQASVPRPTTLSMMMMMMFEWLVFCASSASTSSSNSRCARCWKVFWYIWFFYILCLYSLFSEHFHHFFTFDVHISWLILFFTSFWNVLFDFLKLFLTCPVFFFSLSLLSPLLLLFLFFNADIFSTLWFFVKFGKQMRHCHQISLMKNEAKICKWWSFKTLLNVTGIIYHFSCYLKELVYF